MKPEDEEIFTIECTEDLAKLLGITDEEAIEFVAEWGDEFEIHTLH